MNEYVKLVLSLSISGSILAGTIFAVKPLLKNKLSKSVQYYIWFIVLLRLIIPFSYDTSIMNKMFYNDKAGAVVSAGEENKTAAAESSNIAMQSTNQESAADKAVKPAALMKTINIKALLINNILFIWLFGALVVLTANLIGYIRFKNQLNASNRPAKGNENLLLEELSAGKKRVTLIRNQFAATPMLIGIIKPAIIIPDIDFTDKQLKNILLHELTHLHRFDIPVKWLTIAATSLHWFNPFMYIIKNEINHACELACDEGVIKNMNDEDKQNYGETLISVVAEHKYPIGAVSTTMCEEKRTLKERLVSIMNHSKKSKLITVVSVILFISAIACAVVLGAGVGISLKTPPNIYISSEFEKTKDAIKGGYNWTNGNEHILADSDHPKNFKYDEKNIISVGASEQIVLSTQKIKADKRYNFTFKNIEIYKDGKLFNTLSPPATSYISNNLYLQSPSEKGEYIYCVTLNFIDKGLFKGFCQYGFVVKVGQVKYDANDIETLISIIMSSPQTSSNPGDYIAAHQSEYDGIVNIGEEALPKLIDIIKKGDKGLQGNIAVQLCLDIKEKINTSGDKSTNTEKLLNELDSAISKWKLR